MHGDIVAPITNEPVQDDLHWGCHVAGPGPLKGCVHGHLLHHRCWADSLSGIQDDPLVVQKGQ